MKTENDFDTFLEELVATTENAPSPLVAKNFSREKLKLGVEELRECAQGKYGSALQNCYIANQKIIKQCVEKLKQQLDEKFVSNALPEFQLIFAAKDKIQYEQALTTLCTECNRRILTLREVLKFDIKSDEKACTIMISGDLIQANKVLKSRFIDETRFLSDIFVEKTLNMSEEVGNKKSGLFLNI